jgi:hypothetical protein
MLFAFVYILFFMLDILIIHDFSTLGMIPIGHLVAGVSLFMILFLRKKSKMFPEDDNRWGVYTFFIVYVYSILFTNLFVNIGVISFIYPKLELNVLSYYMDFYLLAFSVFYLYLYRNGLWKNEDLSKWMRWSIIFGLLKPALHVVIFEIPISIYRYWGIVDLAMLFCWLMIITGLIKLEHDSGHTKIRNTFVY